MNKKKYGNNNRIEVKRSKSVTMEAYEKRKKNRLFSLPRGFIDYEPRRRSFYRRKKQTGTGRNISLGRIIGRYRVFLLLLCGLLVFAAIAAGIIFGVYRVKDVTIEGNYHYSNEEIYDFVVGDSYLGQSSVFLFLKYRNREIKNIPFIETMSVKITSPSSIRIVVYEKAMAGFVEYMGKYFYFDKDGTIIESSSIKTKGIPQVLGLEFDHLVLHEKLPIVNPEVFKEILDVTQLLEKYEIEVDRIYFDSGLNLSLYFGEAKIKIGSFENIDEKIIKLKSILPTLKDKSGVLRLDNFVSKDSTITFELD